MSTPEAIVVLSAERAGVATITLNNAAFHNALSTTMAQQLTAAFESAFDDERVRCVLLTGAGQRAFCAGGDLKDEQGDPGGRRGRAYAELLLTMVRAVKPIIARVNGHALGGGLGLVAASHFAIAVEGARLGTPEIQVGLFPMMVMAVLRRVMPRRALTQMMLQGEQLSAERALTLGLLNQVVAPTQLDEAVAKLTASLKNKSASAISLGLGAMVAQEELTLEPALELLRERFEACLDSDDAREGLAAFREKRAPSWSGN